MGIQPAKKNRLSGGVESAYGTGQIYFKDENGKDSLHGNVKNIQRRVQSYFQKIQSLKKIQPASSNGLFYRAVPLELH